MVPGPVFLAQLLANILNIIVLDLVFHSNLRIENEKGGQKKNQESDNFWVFQLLTAELEIGEAIVVDQGKPLYILISSLKIPLISLSL